MLQAIDLTCVRGERTLFSDLSFTLERSASLRVAGANGTGKTSLLRILCGLMLPEQGEVRWQGVSIGRLRDDYWRDLVYVGHRNGVKDDLTAEENVSIGARLAGRQVRRRDALDALGIASCASLAARVLSQGQRRRVALARLFVCARAAVWILDEPFTALDTAAIAAVQKVVGEHIAAGGLAILTTHQEVPIIAASQQRIELGSC
ncbi:MAG: cytochrome c biogenesis heme-transporting ATPase CcmA [Burkholderiales bacterium]